MDEDIIRRIKPDPDGCSTEPRDSGIRVKRDLFEEARSSKRVSITFSADEASQAYRKHTVVPRQGPSTSSNPAPPSKRLRGSVFDRLSWDEPIKPSKKAASYDEDSQDGSEGSSLVSKYDIPIQRHIHFIQRKPIVLAGQPVRVVSENGPGVEGFMVTPRGTATTMHQRFA